MSPTFCIAVFMIAVAIGFVLFCRKRDPPLARADAPPRSNTQVVRWVYGNLPASVVKQLREHGCAG